MKYLMAIATALFIFCSFNAYCGELKDIPKYTELNYHNFIVNNENVIDLQFTLKRNKFQIVDIIPINDNISIIFFE